MGSFTYDKASNHLNAGDAAVDDRLLLGPDQEAGSKTIGNLLGSQAGQAINITAHSRCQASDATGPALHVQYQPVQGELN